MSLSAETKRNLETLGITHMGLEPGGFYQGVEVGGWTDVESKLQIPGPKVEFEDPYSRKIKAFKEIPEPVQLPHTKIVMEKNEHSGLVEEKEYSFVAMDKQPVHEGLLYALQTGIIRYVPEEEMKEKYPDTWAARKSKLVWRRKSDKPEKSSWQLLDEAEQSDAYARNAQEVSEHVKATQKAVIEGKVPPKPNFIK